MVIFLNYFIVLAIAVSLSMDAFSLALSIGTLKLSNKINLFLATLVGVFHFIMPTLGTVLGGVFYSKVHTDLHAISAAIFMYIAIMMFKDYKKEDEVFKLSFVGSLMFALGVSLDSLGVGFTMQIDMIDRLKSFLVFTLCSGTFTFLGLKMGSAIKTAIGNYSVLLGSVIMTILSILNFCQLFSL